jgi:hypothetical protein
MTRFVKVLRSKGWTAKEVAKRWGVSPRWISIIGGNPSQRDWDALDGLPNRIVERTKQGGS